MVICQHALAKLVVLKLLLKVLACDGKCLICRVVVSVDDDYFVDMRKL